MAEDILSVWSILLISHPPISEDMYLEEWFVIHLLPMILYGCKYNCIYLYPKIIPGSVNFKLEPNNRIWGCYLEWTSFHHPLYDECISWKSTNNVTNIGGSFDIIQNMIDLLLTWYRHYNIAVDIIKKLCNYMNVLCILNHQFS